jgi:multiple sugar transport system permease protein
MTKRDRQNLLVGLAFTAPWIVGFGAFLLVPILSSFYYSLTEYSVLTEPVFIGLGNYQDLLADGVFWKSLWNTLLYALLALPLGTLLALVLAVLLNTGVKGLSVYRTVFFFPSLVPMISLAILWLWILNAEFGVLNHALRTLGLTAPSWLGDPFWTKPAFALMSLWTVGNAVVIYLAALQEVPVSLYEAAEIDGAGRWRKLWHVTLPSISPVLFFNGVMGLISCLQVFALPYVMTFPYPGNPARSALFYSMYLYDNAFRYLRMGYACAMAVLLFALILGLTYLLFRATRRHVHYRGG